MEKGAKHNIVKNHDWIYTYAYAPNQIWEPWRTREQLTYWIEDECKNVSGRLKKLNAENENILEFALLADTHYTVNGTWTDTAHSLQKLHENKKLDGIIHLGDMTDGMVPLDVTKEFEEIIKNDLNSFGVPVYITPGNHDYNYFKGNSDLKYPEKPQFYVDYDAQKLRLIFIDSFDPKEKLRYGFTDYCIHWLDAALNSVPKEYCAIIFSHVPPLVRLQAWAKNIRGRNGLIEVLNRYADGILVFINGHNHCDLLFNDLYNGAFPIISINCAKCEYFLEHKPEGAVVPYRELGSRSQESFDIMTIDSKNRTINFTRFGAGEDRIVKNGKAEWL